MTASQISSASSVRRLVEKPALGALLLLVISFALLGPRLSSAGLWDPHEVKLLETASEPFDASTLWQARAFKPKLPTLPLTIGLRIFGLNELGGRTPMLVLGLLTLLTVYGLSRRLSASSRSPGMSALIAGLVLLSSPLFFLSARHASLTLVPMLSQSLALLGLCCLAQPRPERRVLDLGLGTLAAVIGLGGGLLCSGALVGVAAPSLAVLLALALAGGPRLPQLGLGALVGGALLPPLRQLLNLANVSGSLRLGLAAGCFVVAAAAILTLRERRAIKLYGLTTLAAVLAVGLLPGFPEAKPNGYSPWFAGVPHWPATRETQIDSLLRGLGFSLFPWIGLAPLAIAALFAAPSSDETADDVEHADPSRFAAILPLAWFSTTYLLTTLQCSLVSDISFPAAPALALLIGPYLGDKISDERAGSAAAGLCAALGIVMVGHDYFFAPEQYLSGHLSETLRWPTPLAPVGEVLTFFAVGLGALLGAGLAARQVYRQKLVALGIGVAVIAAGVAVQALAPALARHVSYRGLYTRYQKLGGGQLALYGVQQASGRIYGQNSVQLYTLPDVMSFLGNKPSERAFVIIGASELGSVDKEARVRGMRYFIVDDTNAQFLLLSNRLLPGEDDLNPLRRFVSDTAPTPQVPVHATFDDKIELLGYDGPQEVSRGNDLVLRLHYRVLAQVPTTYRVFLHFDGMGTRWNGDHAPLSGKFPTNFWSPGTYVTDEHRMSISRINNAAGYYQIFTGFWPGGDGPRMKITAGTHENDQRVRIGVIRVK